MLTEKDGGGRNIGTNKRRNHPNCGAKQISKRQFIGTYYDNANEQRAQMLLLIKYVKVKKRTKSANER